jgi:hypothetical protein
VNLATFLSYKTSKLITEAMYRETEEKTTREKGNKTNLCCGFQRRCVCDIGWFLCISSIKGNKKKNIIKYILVLK